MGTAWGTWVPPSSCRSLCRVYLHLCVLEQVTQLHYKCSSTNNKLRTKSLRTSEVRIRKGLGYSLYILGHNDIIVWLKQKHRELSLAPLAMWMWAKILGMDRERRRILFKMLCKLTYLNRMLFNVHTRVTQWSRQWENNVGQLKDITYFTHLLPWNSVFSPSASTRTLSHHKKCPLHPTISLALSLSLIADHVVGVH